MSVVALFLRVWPVLVTLRSAEGAEVLDSHFGYPDGIAAAMLSAVSGTPFSITLRGSELLHGHYRLRRRLMGWAIRRADRIVAVSEELAQFAQQLGGDERKISVIPNGIDETIFFPRDRSAVRTRLGLAPDERIILTAGHLIELKGHHRVIAAVKTLRDRGITAKLLIAGGPPSRGVATYETELRSLTAKLDLTDSVQFLGEIGQSELAELFSAADVFCLASSREGCPNVLIEAQACGTPAVAARVGAVPELITSQALGTIVPTQDQQALENALEEALRTDWDRKRIAEHGALRSWRQVAAEVLQVLSAVSQKVQ